jgi:hypothetical protein
MNNNKQMAIWNECEICCEVKWAPECGANTNCDKRVCDDCYMKNRKGAEGYMRKCMFCIEPDYKRALALHMSEYTFNIEYNEEYWTPLGAHSFRVVMWNVDKCMECEDE